MITITLVRNQTNVKMINDPKQNSYYFTLTMNAITIYLECGLPLLSNGAENQNVIYVINIFLHSMYRL